MGKRNEKGSRVHPSWSLIEKVDSAFVQVPLQKEREDFSLIPSTNISNNSSIFQFIPFECSPPPKSFARLMYKALAQKSKEWNPIIVKRKSEEL